MCVNALFVEETQLYKMKWNLSSFPRTRPASKFRLLYQHQRLSPHPIIFFISIGSLCCSPATIILKMIAALNEFWLDRNLRRREHGITSQQNETGEFSSFKASVLRKKDIHWAKKAFVPQPQYNETLVSCCICRKRIRSGGISQMLMMVGRKKGYWAWITTSPIMMPTIHFYNHKSSLLLPMFSRELRKMYV